MSAVSSSQLTNNDIESERERDLLTSFLLLENQDEVRDFLIDIFTETELKYAVKRWCIVRGLFEQTDSRNIQTDCSAHRNTLSTARKQVIRLGTGICPIIHRRLLEHKSKNASHK